MGAPRNRSNTGKYKAVKELQETGKTQVNIKQFGSFKKQELHSKIKCSLGASEAETTQVKKSSLEASRNRSYTDKYEATREL